MISSAVVNRYANALADVVLSPEVGVNAAVSNRPRSLSSCALSMSRSQSSSDLRSVLTSPAIPVARKRAIIKDIAEKLGFARVVTQFRSRRERSQAV